MTRPMHYTLGDDPATPIPAPDLNEWAMWFERAERHVGLDTLFFGYIRVSTVFLGVDHSWSPEDSPVLWETMVFGGPGDGEYQVRYSSYADAVKGHAEAVQMVRRSLFRNLCWLLVKRITRK